MTNSGTKCGKAVNGYYVNSGSICKPCSNSQPGCMECTDQTSPTCKTCYTGYYLNTSNSCIKCNVTMTGCLACSNPSSCLKCTVAFKYNGANLQCSNCLGSCLTCGPFYDTCITCDPAMNRYLSDTSCLCKLSYYDNSASGSYVCPLCSSVLTNCYLCTNNSVCTQCQTNYYLYTSASGKKECQVCSIYCETCTGTSTNCTTCNTVTYNRVLVGNSCVCDVNYISISSGVPCLSCAKMNDGCLSCTN